VVEAFLQTNPAIVQTILAELDRGSRGLIESSAPPEVAEQWKRNTIYPAGTIGQLMEPALAVFAPGMTVGEAIEALRPPRATHLRDLWIRRRRRRGGSSGSSPCGDLLFNDHAARLGDVMQKSRSASRPI
jgi:Mg/Co/Ni transporter MgtE